MDISKIKLDQDVAETLGAIYDKAKRLNPKLDENAFFREIIMEWLEPYKRSPDAPLATREKLVLKNNLKKAVELSGKSQNRIAKEIGINRVYLSQIISGKYEPTITVVLLLARATEYPVEKIKDLFYLEPAEKE